jgi:tetratricopeptide (TPR) repeat protein
LSQLSHPAIVRYVAHGATDAGELYLALEWLDGIDLRERLRAGRLPVDESLAVVLRIAEALSVAHRRGIVHRDVKPSNVFLPGGRVEDAKLLDFGVARLRQGATAVTRTGTTIGTPGYMAPEQARGDTTIDSAVDVFALGCVLHECLTGRAPFDGQDSLSIMLKVMLEDPPRLRDVLERIPPELDDLAARMLSKSRGDRPANAQAVTIELRDLQSQATAETPTARSRILTTAERRMLCLLVARSPEGQRADPEAATVPRVPITGERSLAALASRHRGRLEQLSDGSLVITLSSDGAATDQAARAARCALALRDVLEATSGGVADLAVVACRGVPSSPSMGQVIEQAVALLDRKSAHGVRIDDVVGGLLGERFEVVSEDGVLHLLGERESSDTTRRVLGRRSPFVGRERELGNLLSVFDECVAEPVARAVVLTAPAGVGKSRLRDEFVREVRARCDQAQIWIARGDPMAAGSPFGIIAQAVRAAAGVRAAEPPHISQRKLLARIAQRVHDEDSRARLCAFLAELANLPASPDDDLELRAARRDAMLMGDQLRRALGDFLTAECAANPVVLVLEDLHWGDTASVNLVENALRTMPEAPLMVVALGRPEMTDLFPHLWAGQNAISMRMLELTRRASERLVRGVLGRSVGDDVVARIVEQAAGNAFYLEEMIRAVAAGRADLPETVVAMVQARLESLEAEARRTLRAAAVFGNVFWQGGVASLLGEAVAARAGEWLGELTAREVVTRRRDSRFPDETEYVFRHSLVRESAYAMLTDADRALGHRLAGQWLESVGEHEPVTLGEHFDRGGEPAKAAVWYRRAAEQALEGNDFHAALAQVERGLASAQGRRPSSPGDEPARASSSWRPPPPEIIGGLYLVAAEAHHWRGDLAEAATAAAAALEALPDSSRQAYLAAGQLAEASGRLGNSEPVIRVAEMLLSAPGAELGREVRSAWLLASARTAMRAANAGEHGLRDALAEQLERAAAEDDGGLEPQVEARAEQARASWALARGDVAAGLRHMERAAVAFRRVGDLRSVAVQEINVGYSYLLVGAYQRAETALRSALAAAERMKVPHPIAAAKHNLGLVLVRRGALAEARRTFDQALSAFVVQGDRRLEGATRSYRAIGAMLAGDLAEAERGAREAVAVLVATPQSRARAHAILADVLLRRGRATEARVEARAAMDLLEASGSEDGEATIRLAWAESLHACGEHPAAGEQIRVAGDRLRARAERIPEADLRDSFLEQVPENARTLELELAWLGEHR